MLSNPKPHTYRSEKYLAFIRGLPCIICGKDAEACHINEPGRGMGQKDSDLQTIPMCNLHHMESHKDIVEFCKKRNKDIYKEQLKCLMTYFWRDHLHIDDANRILVLMARIAVEQTN